MMGTLGTNHWRAEYAERCTLRSEGGGWKRAIWYRAGRLPYCDIVGISRNTYYKYTRE